MAPEGVLAHVVERGGFLDWNFLLERQPIRLRGIVHLRPPSAPCGQVRLRSTPKTATHTNAFLCVDTRRKLR